MRCGFLIILTPGLNFDAMCSCFNAVLAMGHIRRQISQKNPVNDALVAFSSFSAKRLPCLTIPCSKNQYAKNQIACLTTSFTIPLQKDKVKISHTVAAFFHTIKMLLQQVT